MNQQRGGGKRRNKGRGRGRGGLGGGAGGETQNSPVPGGGGGGGEQNVPQASAEGEALTEEKRVLNSNEAAVADDDGTSIDDSVSTAQEKKEDEEEDASSGVTVTVSTPEKNQDVDQNQNSNQSDSSPSKPNLDSESETAVDSTAPDETHSPLPVVDPSASSSKSHFVLTASDGTPASTPSNNGDETLRTRLAELEDVISTKNEEIASLQDLHSKEKQTVETLRHDLQKANDDLNSLRHSNNQTSKDFETKLQKALDAEKESARQLQATIEKKWKEQLSLVEMSLRNKENEFGELRGKFDNLKKEKDVQQEELHEQLKKQQKENESLIATIEKLKSEVARAHQPQPSNTYVKPHHHVADEGTTVPLKSSDNGNSLQPLEDAPSDVEKMQISVAQDWDNDQVIYLVMVATNLKDDYSSEYWSVGRRYNQFRALYERLERLSDLGMWFKFPERTYLVSKNDPDVVAERKIAFQKLCQTIAADPVLRVNPTVKKFLDPKQDFDEPIWS